jgi:hypothetical protein
LIDDGRSPVKAGVTNCTISATSLSATLLFSGKLLVVLKIDFYLLLVAAVEIFLLYKAYKQYTLIVYIELMPYIH